MENKKSDNRDLKLCVHSEEYMDVMGKPSMNITVYATQLFLFVLGCIVLACWLVKCPNTISGRVVVSDPSSIVQIVTRSDGVINKIFVKDNETVVAGQVLALIENAANYSDVVTLKNHLVSLLDDRESAKSFMNNMNNSNYELGDLQNTYGDLLMFIRQNNPNNQDVLCVLKVLCRNFLAEIRNWEYNYLLKSPVSGSVCYMTFDGANQYVSRNTCLFAIKSDGDCNVVAKTLVPSNGMGKITKGANCIISLDNYPSEDFGLLNGKVKSISSFPVNGDSYVVTIEFPNGWVTDIGKILSPAGQMVGDVQICIQDRRLYELILQPIVGFLRI